MLRNLDYRTCCLGFMNLHYLLVPDFWPYVFARGNGYGPYFETVLCRLAGHPAGVWWYTSHGLEPDMRCKTCGDDLA